MTSVRMSVQEWAKEGGPKSGGPRKGLGPVSIRATSNEVRGGCG